MASGDVWWVGGYIEAGMGTSGGGTAYLPFVFSDPNDKAKATKDAGAKLLSGPYSTQAKAQAWATAYERNPKTLHAGSDIPAGIGQPVNPGGSGPGGTGTVAGDNPPAGIGGWSLSIGNVTGLLGRIVKVGLGAVLILSGVLKLTGTSKAALGIAGKAAVFA